MLSMFVKELNLFGNSENKVFRKCFLIFLAVTICAYLSIITSHYPHQDDYCRYLINYTCGFHGRYLTRLLEWILQSSDCVADATPFTQILSCGVLAYTAVIFMKILNASYKDLLCFIPIIVCPYVAECMLFKFDNFFMIIANFFATAAAYVASKNNKESVSLQIILLLCALTTYQSAINIYGIIFLYKLIKEVSTDSSIWQAIKKMRYWIYAATTTAVIMIPIRLTSGIYCTNKSGNFFIFPNNFENIKAIYSNILFYFSDITNDWSCNSLGILTFIFLIFATLVFIRKCYFNTRSFGKTLFIVFLLIIFFEMPYGIMAFSHFIDIKGFIMPRILSGMCFVISIAFFELNRELRFNRFSRIILKFSVFLWAVWNITFTNSIGNIMYQQEKMCYELTSRLAEDIYNLFPKNSENYCIYFTNEAITPSANNFTDTYPIANKILTKNWPTAYLFAMLFHKIDIPQITDISATSAVDENVLKNAKLIKSGLRYNIHMHESDNKKIICVTFKQSKQQSPANSMISLDIFFR